jgi:hypothetical protein
MRTGHARVTVAEVLLRRRDEPLLGVYATLVNPLLPSVSLGATPCHPLLLAAGCVGSWPQSSSV